MRVTKGTILSARPRLWHRFTLAVASCAGLIAAPSIPVIAVGSALVFSGLSQQAVAATVWYIDGTSGVDTNNGTSPSTPRATPPTDAATANGDTIYVQGTIRSSAGNAATITYTHSNMTIAAWPGGTQPIFHGGTLTGTGWTPIGGNKYTKPHATSLTISRWAFKYDASVTATGQHFGVLVQAAGANNSGEVDYDSLTGNTTINVPSAPTVAADVMYALADAVVSAIQFTGGTNNTVSGQDFKFYPSSSGQFGWGVCTNGGANLLVYGCRFWDMGNHSAGTLGGGVDCSGAMIVACTHYSGRPDCSPFVFFQNNAAGNLTACRLNNCTIHFKRHTGVDGVTATAGQAANTQTAIITHSDAGTPIRDILLDGCRLIGYAGEDATLVGASFTSTPTNLWDWSTFPVRADRCTFTNMAFWRGGFETLAVRRSSIDLTRAGSSALNGLSTQGMLYVPGGKRLLLESCTVTYTATNDGAGGFFIGFLMGADGRFCFLNTSVWNTGTQAGTNMFQGDFTSGGLFARGTVFGSNVGFQLLTNDADAGFTLDVSDCAYFNVTAGAWSSVASRNTAAEWLATVDAAQYIPPSAPFPLAPSSLALNTSSPLWFRKRTSSAIVPLSGINVPCTYGGFFGAYQYPNTRDLRTVRAMRVSR